jgi:very-short-patch-repair endonuclease/predicted transcriptional regulator of viral defense system
MVAVRSDRWEESAGWPDARIAELAGRQEANITTRQLRALGVSSSAITRARQRERLHPVHFGVYSLVVPEARPRLAAEFAAWLACGPGAVISHLSAGWLQGLVVHRPELVDVTVIGADRGRARRDLRAHRAQSMARGEIVRLGRLPVTSVARTVVDLLPLLGDRPLERAVDQALTRTSRAKLREAAERHSRRPGIARLAVLLDPARPSSDTWSVAEERLRELIRRAELPLPEANLPIGPYRPDLVWRRERGSVEYDSDRFHSGARRRYADARRHNDLTSWGWEVLHITREDLDDHPERVLAWIAAALARAGARR